MSYCRQEGKDKIIFVTKEDHATPSNAELIADDPNDPYEDHDTSKGLAAITIFSPADPLATIDSELLAQDRHVGSKRHFLIGWRQPGTQHFQEKELCCVLKGLILPSGEINWNCPCLGGMASGPCGEQFKSAFSCFHYSQEEVKGSDCIDQFRGMQECMQKYPDLYPQEDDEEGSSKDTPDTELEAAPPEASEGQESS